MFFRKKKQKNEYDTYLAELLKLVKTKGILVETMQKGSSILTADSHTKYKKDLGAVSLKDRHGNVTNIYLAYEDFDGTIKYYDYPQYTEKEISGMRKEYEQNHPVNQISN